MKKIVTLAGVILAVYGAIGAPRPGRIVDLAAFPTNGGMVLSWTVPASALNTTLTNVDVRFSTRPITELNWNDNARLDWLTDPGTSGSKNTAVITDLMEGTTYYFAVKVQDSSGTWSLVSNTKRAEAGSSTYSLTFAWDPSESVGVSGYNLYVGTNGSRNYDRTLDAGNVTQFSVTNFIYGTTYFVAVTAYGTNSESGYSSELTFSYPGMPP